MISTCIINLDEMVIKTTWYKGIWYDFAEYFVLHLQRNAVFNATITSDLNINTGHLSYRILMVTST